MSRARISVGAEVDWTAEAHASAVLLVRAAEAADQEIVEETLEVDGARVEEGPVRDDGARPIRLHAPPGAVRLRYRALVDVEQDRRAAVADDRSLPPASELPFSLLPWILPSRYSPSDLLGATAQAELGLGPRARALLPTAAAWVRTRIAYIPGASDALTSADETLLRRQGVCRDMAHLTVSLLRALDIPARVAACYAPLVDPPDFHALVEAHDGEAWRLMDATGLAPVETIVRVAWGRDAADIAWATGDEALVLEDLRVAAGNTGPPG
jgi:transglutaminase-like putative cysteine protease